MYCQMNYKLTVLSAEKTVKDVLENTYSSQHLKMPQNMKTYKCMDNELVFELVICKS